MGKYGIQTEDVYNFDETGFQIGVVSGGKVLVPDDCQAAYVSDPDNRVFVTVVATIGATGRSVPPMIIFKGAHHLRKYFDNDMEKDVLWARSESGFSNNSLGLEYLKHFDRFTKKNSVGSYRLLIFDGHGSHLTEEFVDYCWQNKVRPFLLPPHLTHVLQPLDIGIFSTLKHNFKKAVRREVYLGATEIEKADFFRFFQSFYSQTVTRKHAISAFLKSGLVPLDSSYAFEKLKNFGENI